MEARQLSNGIGTWTLSILSPEVGYIAFAVLGAKSRGQELCEGRGGRPGPPSHNKPEGFCRRKAILKRHRERSELRSCVKVEVGVLGFPSLISLMVSVVMFRSATKTVHFLTDSQCKLDKTKRVNYSPKTSHGLINKD